MPPQGNFELFRPSEIVSGAVLGTDSRSLRNTVSYSGHRGSVALLAIKIINSATECPCAVLAKLSQVLVEEVWHNTVTINH